MKMIRKKIKKDTYAERITDTAYRTLYDALKSILTTDVKKTNAEGKEIMDLGMTLSAVRMKARMALDFVDNLKTEIADKQ